MIKKILNFANKVIPKGKVIIFNSFPDVSGNAFSLYKYIASNHPDLFNKYTVIWMINNYNSNLENKIKSLPNTHNVMICKKKSLKGLFLYCRSLYIITTHNYITGVQTYGAQKHYNLWHGMPLKTIGNMLKHSVEGDVIQADYAIATSELFQDIIAKSFGIDKNRVFITGQPCNDDLFESDMALNKLNISKTEYKEIIIWMPTYRTSDVGALRVDGQEDSFGVIDAVIENIDELQGTLRKNLQLLIIKPHPMDSIKSKLANIGGNIKIINNENLDKANITLYQLIADTDCLITDYSSVYIDYLNTGKPIAFVYSDMKEYSGNRGFSFKNPEEYLPGEKIHDFKELINYLDNIQSINNNWQKEYKRVQSEFNLYSDSNSSERVFKCIFNK